MAEIVKFNPNNGQPLAPGETVTFQGKTYTGGSTNISGSPTSSSPPTQNTIQTTQSSTVNNPTPTQPATFSLQGGNLAVGSQGNNVMQLQQALNAAGANPPLIVDGKFGPKTQTAVQQYQTTNGLKADGIVGPLTELYFALVAKTTNQTQTTTPNAQLGLLGAIADVATNTYSTKNSGLTLDEALKAAQNDPNIIAKYSDMLKLDQQGFQQQLQQLQQSTQTQEQQQQTQFENDRKQLAEQKAAAGQAYSGFRGEAQKQLGESQSGIVQSSRSALQKSLNDMTSAFEQKYGSGSAQSATSNFTDPYTSSNVGLSGLGQTPQNGTSTLAGQLAGGITGQAPVAQKQDVLNKGSQLYQEGQLPNLQ